MVRSTPLERLKMEICEILEITTTTQAVCAKRKAEQVLERYVVNNHNRK